MAGLVRGRLTKAGLRPAVIVIAVLGGSLALGFFASGYMLAGVAALMGLFLLLMQPGLGLLMLVAAALVAKFDIPTGTQVVLNPSTLMVPTLLGLALVAILTRRPVELSKSRVLLPMALFMVAGVVSMFIGNATWDPFVPRGGNLAVVQLSQLALTAFAFVAFWLTASLGREVRWLKWMSVALLTIGGFLALLLVLPPTEAAAYRIGTTALIRAPLWLLLTAVAGGQLLFNERLTSWQRVACGAIVAIVIVYTFFIGREAASNWVGVGSTLTILAWLKLRNLRWLALVIIILLLLSGIVFPTIWNFAGGDDEWTGSGQSRLVLIERVLSVSMRNPVTGLGPVAYRSYAGMEPLAYGRAFWLEPQINSHNNYVDIFAQYGLVGIGLFAWMVVELVRLGWRLLGEYEDGFEGGYIRGMLAAGAGAMAVMLFADWVLPFVYNIGFPGFQASVLLWMFLGGLVALEGHGQVPDSDSKDGSGGG